MHAWEQVSRTDVGKLTLKGMIVKLYKGSTWRIHHLFLLLLLLLTVSEKVDQTQQYYRFCYVVKSSLKWKLSINYLFSYDFSLRWTFLFWNIQSLYWDQARAKLSHCVNFDTVLHACSVKWDSANATCYYYLWLYWGIIKWGNEKTQG